MACTAYIFLILKSEPALYDKKLSLTSAFSDMTDLERMELDLRRRNEEIDAKNREVDFKPLEEIGAGNSNAAPCSPTKPPPGTKIPVKKRTVRPSAVGAAATVRRSSSSSRLMTSEVTERLADEICKLVREGS